MKEETMDVDMAPAGAASVQDTPLNQQSLAALGK
jgi:hypothetical protein